MSDKRKLRVPDNQLTLIPMETAPPEKEQPRATRRVDSLEGRVTHLEAEVTLIRGQLEREENDESND